MGQNWIKLVQPHHRCSMNQYDIPARRTAPRVDTTNNNADWTKTKQGLTLLIHDTRLTNGRHATLHTALPVGYVRIMRVKLTNTLSLTSNTGCSRLGIGCSMRSSRQPEM